jgi:hypothetical protein
MKRSLFPLTALTWALSLARAAGADQTVQVPLDSLLEGRPVSTFTGGAIVQWTKGVDQSNGFATSAAVAALGQTGPGLPDDGTFPANSDHPNMVLHFSNTAEASSGQAHIVPAAGSFSFEVPHATYSKLLLAITSSSGDSALTATLDYADGSPTTVSFTLPDWGTGKPLPTDPPIFFNLISGLHKWDAQDNSVDTPSHALTGVALSLAGDRVLTKVEVNKPGAAEYVVFWGATGIATSTIGGASGGAGGQASGGSGGAAAAGEAGTGGTREANAGSGGASGMAASAGSASSSGASASGGNAGVGGSSAGSANASATPTSADSGGCAVSTRENSSHPAWALVCALFVCAWQLRSARASIRKR